MLLMHFKKCHLFFFTTIQRKEIQIVIKKNKRVSAEWCHFELHDTKNLVDCSGAFIVDIILALVHDDIPVKYTTVLLCLQ